MVITGLATVYSGHFSLKAGHEATKNGLPRSDQACQPLYGVLLNMTSSAQFHTTHVSSVSTTWQPTGL